jgi:hypothetical protein
VLFSRLIDAIYRNTEVLIDAIKEVGLEVNTEKTKYIHMLLCCHQNAGQNHNARIVNKSFKNVAKVQTCVNESTTSNLIHEEIKSRLNSGNACYYPVQNLLSSRPIS